MRAGITWYAQADRRKCDIFVAPGAITQLGALLDDRRRVAVVSQHPVSDHYADRVRCQLRDSELFLVGEGEEAKTLATVEDLSRRFASWGLLRDDAVVALGGGVIGDTAGFAAAVYHRGVDVVQVPTTLLAQIDSAIGGKTGVNLPEGKNLVGAFHQPFAVVADIETLETLPEQEFRSGLGEVAKYALLPDPEDEFGLLDLVRTQAADIVGRDAEVLRDLVHRCAAMKSATVLSDPFERKGQRVKLNYGHTFAHALETAGGYALAHGEAVAVGLVFAGELARALERIDATEADAHRELVAALGLPTAAPEGVRAADLLPVMRRDKKASGGLTFVLRGPDGLETVDDPPAPALENAFRAVGVDVP